MNPNIPILYTGISWSKAGLLNSSMKYGSYNYIDIMNCCRPAFFKTITEDKTIDVEAFIDNILERFNKLNR